MRRSVLIAGLVAMAVIGAGVVVGESKSFAADAQAKPASTAEVKIDNFSFGPTAITVAVGTTVTWTNRDDIPHTVRATDGSFTSRPMDSGDHYSFTFAKPGVYTYFCSIHPKMTGKVVVQ